MATRKTSRTRQRNRAPQGTDETTGAPLRAFSEWRAEPSQRNEDAAYAFGYHLIARCRDEALNTIPVTATAIARACAVAAIDAALHNVCDMLEGFWHLQIDPAHHIELALQVRVCNASGNIVETHEISPCKLDLPIGYWKWAHHREFR
ncbi:MAG TPA: hypothetical protein VGD80_09430 [Kofleriaceae bacterium]